MQFIEWQMLPSMLANAAVPGGAPSEEECERIANLLRELLVWCCVEPRVSTEPRRGRSQELRRSCLEPRSARATRLTAQAPMPPCGSRCSQAIPIASPVEYAEGVDSWRSLGEALRSSPS